MKLLIVIIILLILLLGFGYTEHAAVKKPLAYSEDKPLTQEQLAKREQAKAAIMAKHVAKREQENAAIVANIQWNNLVKELDSAYENNFYYLNNNGFIITDEYKTKIYNTVIKPIISKMEKIDKQKTADILNNSNSKVITSQYTKTPLTFKYLRNKHGKYLSAINNRSYPGVFVVQSNIRHAADDQLWAFDGNKLVNKYGNCLNVNGDTNDNGIILTQSDCVDDNKKQMWKMMPNGTIINGYGKCLDVIGNSPANGTKMQQWDCINNEGQSWEFIDSVQSAGYYRRYY